MQRSIFAWEVCFSLPSGSALLPQLRAAVVDAPAGMSFHDKWQMYRNITDLLGANMYTAVRGCWDFFDDDERAIRDFDMWTKGMTTREGVRAGPMPIYAYRGHERFMTFTMAFLLMQDTPAERALQQRCAVPQQQLWKRHTFEKLLHGVPAINFSSVVADIAYVLPGRDEEWGLTADDLAQEKFKYLRVIE